MSQCRDVLDPDAPTIPAYETVHRGSTVWRVLCRYCNKWHEQGAAEGHRIAHCSQATSPYHRSGYNSKIVVSDAEADSQRAENK